MHSGVEKTQPPSSLPTLLALDCAAGPASVALLRGAHVLAARQETETHTQARALVPMLEEALTEAGLWYGDISEIACTVGPGSFTGLRIGLATARAIGFSAGIPVRGVTTLSALAMAACMSNPEQQRPVLALLNAGKGEAYFQVFATKPGLSALTPPALGATAAITAMATQYDALPLGYTEALNLPPDESRPRLPSASAAGMLALRFPALLPPPEPFYIRPPDAIPQASVASVAGAG